jgi:hypothetical protein
LLFHLTWENLETLKVKKLNVETKKIKVFF